LRGLRFLFEPRNLNFGFDRRDQLPGDEHQAAADIPLRRDTGALVELAKPRDRTDGSKSPKIGLRLDSGS
jgi:hypothetical protein